MSLRHLARPYGYLRRLHERVCGLDRLDDPQHEERPEARREMTFPHVGRKSRIAIVSRRLIRGGA
jgi:hypothetical protein